MQFPAEDGKNLMSRINQVTMIDVKNKTSLYVIHMSLNINGYPNSFLFPQN